MQAFRQEPARLPASVIRRNSPYGQRRIPRRMCQGTCVPTYSLVRLVGYRSAVSVRTKIGLSFASGIVIDGVAQDRLHIGYLVFIGSATGISGTFALQRRRSHCHTPTEADQCRTQNTETDHVFHSSHFILPGFAQPNRNPKITGCRTASHYFANCGQKTNVPGWSAAAFRRRT